jgi:hypothetical protein
VRESLLGRPDEPPGLVALFLLSEMAAIAALHLLQRGRERYGSEAGALHAGTAFVGLALTVGGYILSERYERLGVISLERLGTTTFLVGVLVATAGIIGLAVVSIIVRILPRWGGVALIAGNTFLGVLILVVTNASVSPIGSWLVASPWIVVGFAVFLAAGRRTERPSRVR